MYGAIDVVDTETADKLEQGDFAEIPFALRERLIAGLHELEGVTINGYEDRRNAPQIVSASFAGVRAEVLLHAL